VPFATSRNELVHPKVIEECPIERENLNSMVRTIHHKDPIFVYCQVEWSIEQTPASPIVTKGVRGQPPSGSLVGANDLNSMVHRKRPKSRAVRCAPRIPIAGKRLQQVGTIDDLPFHSEELTSGVSLDLEEPIDSEPEIERRLLAIDGTFIDIEPRRAGPTSLSILPAQRLSDAAE